MHADPLSMGEQLSAFFSNLGPEGQTRFTQFTDADGRPTLKDYLPVPGVYAAGRLDRDSEGLLLLTDDGALQHRLSDPRHKLPKTYWVQVEGEPDDKALERLRRPWFAGGTIQIASVQADGHYLAADAAAFDVRTPSVATPASALSGGNQQKLIVAREFSRPIQLLIAAQPTRGLDVGSIEYIHNRIIAKRDEGTAVLLVSSELDEILALSDRIGRRTACRWIWARRT